MSIEKNRSDASERVKTAWEKMIKSGQCKKYLATSEIKIQELIKNLSETQNSNPFFEYLQAVKDFIGNTNSHS